MTVHRHHPRRLLVFSLDPAADVRLDTAMISRCVLDVEWEDDLKPGPIGEYVEVVDFDPASGCGYDPVDLDTLLATDGMSPSTGDPQFHQQMVYAVAMFTIKNFERILGRRVTWSERKKYSNGKYISRFRDRFVQRLRIYPHALRQQNAYYSPSRKSMLFGYFNAPTTDPRDELPGGLVFTCLSHDIIAHETTHAILDGIHPRLLDASNADMLAFHEAFADIVAIFQHFTLPDLIFDQIQKTRGELARNNLLAQLASQFARSTAQGDALRNALGEFDENGNREPSDPAEFGRTTEPHARGAILVAAIFDAFLRIYEDRVADLRRIATHGTGILPDGDIHPDLAQRFAAEAAKAAGRVLKICIRAIDYLPPVDITFGDYLRALITADADAMPEDPHRYRLAFIESFRERGIYPHDVRTLSEESLRWGPVSDAAWTAIQDYLPPLNILRTMAYAYEASDQFVRDVVDRKSSFLRELTANGFDAAARTFLAAAWGIGERKTRDQTSEGREKELYNRFVLDKAFCIVLHEWISEKAKQHATPAVRKQLEWNLGLDLEMLASADSKKDGRLEVHAVRPTIRTRPDGRTKTELLVVLTQRVYEDLVVVDAEENETRNEHQDSLRFKYRGGCTLIIDPEDGRVEYAISKCLTSERRKGRHAAFMSEQVANSEQDAVTKFGLTKKAASERLQMEPLAFIHSHADEVGGLY
jgi:hypothetical protein